MTTTRFKDRHDAGWRLAVALAKYQDSDPIVLGLPRGGIPVTSEVAEALHAPLDVVVVRKLGVPFHPELAMGAIGEGGALVVDEAIMDDARVGQSDLQRIIDEERAELDRRVLRYRQHRPMHPLAGRTVIVVDDGIATGSTARAALQVVRSQDPKRIILAVLVAAPDSIRQLRQEADEVVVLEQPPSFNAVGSWYDDFAETTDEEVARLIAQARDTLFGEPGTLEAAGDSPAIGSSTTLRRSPPFGNEAIVHRLVHRAAVSDTRSRPASSDASSVRQRPIPGSAKQRLDS